MKSVGNLSDVDNDNDEESVISSEDRNRREVLLHKRERCIRYLQKENIRYKNK